MRAMMRLGQTVTLQSVCEGPDGAVGRRHGRAHESTFARGRALLDDVQAMIEEGWVRDGMEALVWSLLGVRASLPREDWDRFIQTVCMRHPLKRLIHQSPFSRRAFEKPRGYPGDAVVLDFMYGSEAIPNRASALGRALYEQWEFWTPSCLSVRARRDILTDMVDRVAARVSMPRILSVACGHLREAETSMAVLKGRVGEYVALDNDPATLEVVKREHAAERVTTVRCGVKSLIVKRPPLGTFDFIYAAGLYNYLSGSVAPRLTTTLLTMLKPGGFLWVANFAPNLRDIGYLEAFMDWRLLYRDESSLESLVDAIPSIRTRQSRTFRDKYQNVVFLEIAK